MVVVVVVVEVVVMVVVMVEVVAMGVVVKVDVGCVVELWQDKRPKLRCARLLHSTKLPPAGLLEGLSAPLMYPSLERRS